MRLAAITRGGFYPIAPEVVRLIAGLIQYEDGPILDPCAGEGEALDVLGQALGAAPEKLYAIELERERSANIRDRLPQAHLLGPCSCFETRISNGSCSVAFVNAPFDQNIHGGRAEVDFRDEHDSAFGHHAEVAGNHKQDATADGATVNLCDCYRVHLLDRFAQARADLSNFAAI